MSARKTEITPADLLPPAQYAAERKELRKAMVAMKKVRRVAVGPCVTFYFENFATMLQQVQEMLHIEKGGEAQIADELRAYNPLVPKGAELVATVMFEIEDPDRRHALLSTLGGVEDCFVLHIGGEAIKARPEDDLERTTQAGKTSSVHFIHFDLSPTQIAAFKTPGTVATVGITHPNYGHLAMISEATRAALAEDLD